MASPVAPLLTKPQGYRHQEGYCKNCKGVQSAIVVPSQQPVVKVKMSSEKIGTDAVVEDVVHKLQPSSVLHIEALAQQCNRCKAGTLQKRDDSEGCRQVVACKPN